jgi:hypothetical protein
LVNELLCVQEEANAWPLKITTQPAIGFPVTERMFWPDEGRVPRARAAATMENAVRAATRLKIFILASDIDTAAEQLE